MTLKETLNTLLSLNTLLKKIQKIPLPKKTVCPDDCGDGGLETFCLKMNKKTDGAWLWYRQTIDGVNTNALSTNL